MTAQRKIEDRATEDFTAQTVSMFDGEGTRMYSSGSAPTGFAETLDGEATGAFSSGSAPVAVASQSAGDETGLFSSG